MTISEIVAEVMIRGDGQKYAGGMTSGEIDDIKAASSAFRAKRAKRLAENGA